jgi:hypothetical protein
VTSPPRRRREPAGSASRTSPSPRPRSARRRGGASRGAHPLRDSDDRDHPRQHGGQLLPQGWAFFTRSLNQSDIAAYTGDLGRKITTTNSDSRNDLGINDAQRTEGPEISTPTQSMPPRTGRGALNSPTTFEIARASTTPLLRRRCATARRRTTCQLRTTGRARRTASATTTARPNQT